MGRYRGLARHGASGAVTLRELQARLSVGAVTAESLVRDCIARTVDFADRHAWTNLPIDEALIAARASDRRRLGGAQAGVLEGIPLAIKDNIDVAGMPTTAGSAALRDRVPSRDATLVGRLRDAGAILLGKNGMDELALGVTGVNPAFGDVRNAVDPLRSSGGSSGGTAVAVATGMALAGVGTDTAGSLRIPAALNGVVGFRPSTGRYPMDGILGLSWTRDCAGPITLCVDDAALLDAVMAGEDDMLPSAEPADLSLGVPRALFCEALQADVSVAFEQRLAALRTMGVRIVDVDLPGLEEATTQMRGVVVHEFATLLPDYLRVAGIASQDFLCGVMTPSVREIAAMALSGKTDGAVWQDAVSIWRPRLREIYAACFTVHRIDALIFPTTPVVACTLSGGGQMIVCEGRELPAFPTWVRNVDAASCAGIPAISLPCGRDREGLPVGVELDAPPGQDRRLLAIARCVESIGD